MGSKIIINGINWLWNRADTIGIGCMWLAAAIDLVILRKLDDACVWALFATVCMVQTRHRAELNRLRIEANVTKELIGAIVTDLDRALKCVQIRRRQDAEDQAESLKAVAEFIKVLKS